jgi:excinuclease UvrABC helicase subunit UvrB
MLSNDTIENQLNLKVESLCKKGDFFTFSVCSLAPNYLWSEIEYIYREEIVELLRKKNYRVSMEINHGVIDYKCRKIIKIG